MNPFQKMLVQHFFNGHKSALFVHLGIFPRFCFEQIQKLYVLAIHTKKLVEALYNTLIVVVTLFSLF